MKAAFPLLFWLGMSPITAHAAPDQPDSSESAFLDLSIEELFDIAVYSRQLLGLHHTHPRGEWMLGYSNMHMEMDGNRDGTSNQSVADVFDAGFMIAPTEMSMNMQMFEAMYGVTDDLTVMVMLPFNDISMGHINPASATFTTESSGVGDISITGLYSIFQKVRASVSPDCRFALADRLDRRKRCHAARAEPEAALSNATGLGNLRSYSGRHLPSHEKYMVLGRALIASFSARREQRGLHSGRPPM